MRTRWRYSPRWNSNPAACPTLSASSAVSVPLLAFPRMPSVPKYLRAIPLVPWKRGPIQARPGGAAILRHTRPKAFKKCKHDYDPPCANGRKFGGNCPSRDDSANLGRGRVTRGESVLHRVLLGLVLTIAAGAAIADDADLCGDDGADPSARADACTRIARTGKYRGSNLAAVYNNRGIANRRQNELTRAHADYTEAIRLNPQYDKAYYNRALLWSARGNAAQAIEDYTKAIAINPRLADALNNRGLLWQAKGDSAKALADYDDAIQANPRLARAFFNRAILHGDNGDVDRAIADYGEAIRLDPADAAAYLNRGNAWQRRGEHDRAIADY